MKRRRSVSRPTTVACLLLLAVSASGCGFIFSHAPPEGHERLDYFTCTESDAGPIIDVVWASLNVIGALAIAADADNYVEPGPYIVSGLAWGVFSGAAAGVGFNKSKKCRGAKRQLAERQVQGRVAQPAPTGEATEVQSVVLTPAVDTLAVGERLQLIAAAHASSGATIPSRVFVWSSSNDAIASVSSSGLVTAHASGSVVVAARTGNVVGTASVVVLTRR